MANKKIDWKLSSCCGVSQVKVAGILRCKKCQREIVSDQKESAFHMFDVHDFNYQRGEDD